jgi:hypothetical protein
MTDDPVQIQNAGAGTRRSPTERADHVVTPGDSIQAAVDGASSGEVVAVEPGVYTEQVVLDGHVTLVGAGRGDTVIRSPPSLPRGFSKNDDEFFPVVLVENDGAAVRSLTVDGDRQGHGNEAFVGVGSHDANLSLEDVEVRGVGDEIPGGASHGFGVFVTVEDGANRQAEISRCEVHGYQRGGVVGDGAGLDIYVEESTVTGRDSDASVRQNGVQVSSVDRATVVGCTVSDNHHLETTQASGVNLVNASDVFLAWNTVECNDIGVAAARTDEVVVRRNNVHSNGLGVLNFDREPFDTTNNWWGADDGPSRSNIGADAAGVDAPGGSGDTVCNVEWDPYSEDRFDLRASPRGGAASGQSGGHDTDTYGSTDIR